MTGGKGTARCAAVLCGTSLNAGSPLPNRRNVDLTGGKPLFDAYAYPRFAEPSVCLLGDALPEHGQPIVLHRNRGPSVFRAEIVNRPCLLGAAALPHVVITAYEKRRGPVLLVPHDIVRHADIAGAVAEGQHRALADLLGDHGDLGHLQVLLRNLSAQHQFIMVAEDILRAGYIPLVLR